MKSTDALYVISVAARLVALHPTTLRKYEREGFLEPSRSPGRTRLYSLRDILRLRQVKRLVDERRLNLEGVKMALEVTELLHEVALTLESARDLETARGRLQAPLRRAFSAVGATD